MGEGSVREGNRVVGDMFLEHWWKKWPVAKPCAKTSSGVLKELRKGLEQGGCRGARLLMSLARLSGARS